MILSHSMIIFYFRMGIVLFVSAFWHGVYPGYYVTFMSVPLMILSDNQLCMMVRPYLKTQRQLYYFEWARWALLYRIYEYLSVGFIMLKLDIVWKVYKQNYFIGHIFMLVVSVLPFLLPKRKPNMKETMASRDSAVRDNIKHENSAGPKVK